MSLTPLHPDELAGRHLLVLPDGVGADEVEMLAVSRFPRAAWAVLPSTAPLPVVDGARAARPAPVTVGELRLSRHSVLRGPYALDRGAVTALSLPTAARLAYVLESPVERGAPPWPGTGDRDGLGRAFPDGLPIRDEERSVRWVVDVARRLAGAVRIARADGTGAVLVPDPAAAVDLTVWTDIWLEPEAALTVVRRAAPSATLNLPTGRWAGPPRHVGARPAPGVEGMSDERRRELHAAADAHDLAALTDPAPLEAYGTLADLGVDGIVAVEIGGETDLPPVMSEVAWAAQGAVAYRVRWEPADLTELHAERPGPEHRVARTRATRMVVELTRALHGTVGGEITDEMGFVVDPADV